MSKAPGLAEVEQGRPGLVQQGENAQRSIGGDQVAAGEIFRPLRPAVGKLDGDAGVVLHDPRHFTAAIDRYRQLAGPAGQDAPDMVLRQPEHVVVPGGKVADVQGNVEVHDLMHLSLRKEPAGDSTLIEHFDGA